MEPTVLLVDDEVNVTEGLGRALFAEPLRILTASSGFEALDILTREHVDVVVSDEQMPGMSGSELLARVRCIYPSTARIILTGQASLEATVRAINEAGVFRFLRKPCRPPEVAASIFAALDRSAVRGVSCEDDRLLDAAFDSLYVVFQPIVSARSRRPIAVEALARTRHPEFPTIGSLIEVAEARRRMVELDKRIFDHIAASAPLLPRGLDLFVNIHPQTLGDLHLGSDDCPLAPFFERVVIEITERAVLHAGDSLTRALTSLRTRGLRIALDDLGGGHAGLLHVAIVAPDVIKLDMSLVRGIDRSPMLSNIVASMLDLGRRLNIPIVAEGVETRGEEERLVSLGCELLQGFLYFRPAAIGDLDLEPLADGAPAIAGIASGARR